MTQQMIRSQLEDPVKDNHFKKIVDLGRQAESMLILQSLGVTKGCKCPCVYNMDLL
jgi:hypothetical protein